MNTSRASVLPTSAILIGLLSACAGTPMSTSMPTPYSQAALPSAVQVPVGHVVAMETVGAGGITYECRDKPAAMGQYEWAFVGPSAELRNRQGRVVGRYFGPPATWAANDGSAITGAQVAVVPAAAGSIPLQLVKANPATGQGAMSGLSYVQRVATQGGVAPAATCDASAKGRREIVKYQADYIFWKPA
jgi:hypothetical protein